MGHSRLRWCYSSGRNQRFAAALPLGTSVLVCVLFLMLTDPVFRLSTLFGGVPAAAAVAAAAAADTPVSPPYTVVQLNASDPQANDLYGYAIALYTDYVLVGASAHSVNGAAGAGVAYLFFHHQNGLYGWGQNARLQAPTPRSGDAFGSALHISEQFMAVGAPGREINLQASAGAVFVYRTMHNDWSLIGNLTGSGTAGARFGASVASSGRCVLAGEPVAAAAYVHCYNSATGAWARDAAWVVGDLSRFGWSVALTPTLAAVGAAYTSGQGYVRVYRRLGIEGSGQWTAAQQFDSAQPFDFFGSAVAFSDSGAQLAIGAQYGSAVYVYAINSTHIVRTDVVVPSVAQSTDYFGCTVALTNGLLVVGALGRDVTGLTDAGALYTYWASASRWQQARPLDQLKWGLMMQADVALQVSNMTVAGAVAATRAGTSLAASARLVAVGANQGAYVLAATCPPGYARHPVSGACEICPPGSYSEVVNAPVCAACAVNTSTRMAGASNASACVGGRIAAVVPSIADTGGGYRVTISGTDLGNSTDIVNVTLVGRPVRTVLEQNRTYVVVEAAPGPPSTRGEVVVVSASFGTTVLSNGFMYNQPPALVQPFAFPTADAWVLYRFAVPASAFSDADGDSISFVVDTPFTAWPDWLHYNQSIAEFEGVPTSFGGTVTLRVNATDGYTTSTFLFELKSNALVAWTLLAVAGVSIAVFAYVGRLFVSGAGMSHIADAYERRDFAEAERITLESIRIRKRELGAEHPATIAAQHDLACIYRHQGRLAEAEELLNRLIHTQLRRHGLMHGSVSALVHTLARVYRNQRRDAEADSLVRRGGVRGYFLRPVYLPADKPKPPTPPPDAAQLEEAQAAARAEEKRRAVLNRIRQPSALAVESDGEDGDSQGSVPAALRDPPITSEPRVIHLDSLPHQPPPKLKPLPPPLVPKKSVYARDTVTNPVLQAILLRQPKPRSSAGLGHDLTAAPATPPSAP